MTPRHEVTGATIAQFRIEGKLGEGGMGVVYQARDLRLDRSVALKFLPDRLAADARSLERFRREARAASALNHPNVCTIYDIAEFEGRPFIVMELLLGRTLRQHLARGPLRIDEALAIAAQTACGLEAAHATGIIHRDIKPANIFITQSGAVKITDFGVAKLDRRRTGDSEATTEVMVTKPGSRLGTLSYMSPEQARGDPLDARTDLFSLGIVLYEIATGVRPFTGETDAAILQGVLFQTPAPPSRLNPALPPAFEHLVLKALEKDRDSRYQTASELRADVQRLQRDQREASAPREASRLFRRRKFLAAGVVILLVFAAFVVFWKGSGLPGRRPTISPTIAVLPFTDMSPQQEQEHFGDGLTEDLQSQLTRVSGLRVAGGVSSGRFKGKAENPRVIGKELNVSTLLQGSVRKQGNRVRITAHLIRAADGFALWSDTFDRDLNDIFALQSEIARSVAGALQVKLLPEKAAPPSPPSTDPEAYSAYLQGRYFLGRGGKTSLEQAAGNFAKAVRLDPGLARAWVGLGECLSVQGGTGYIPLEQAVRDARDAIERALKLDSNLADAHAALAEIKMLYEWDWKGADQSYRRALALEPGNPNVLRGAGALDRFLGRLDDAIALYRRAIEIDPLSPRAYKNLGMLLHYAGRQEEARSALSKALDLNSETSFAHHYLGQVYLAQSRFQEALAESEKETTVYRYLGLALACHALGRERDFDVNIAKLMEDMDYYQAAEAYAFRGEPGMAFVLLDKAYRLHDPGLCEIKTDPLLRGLRFDTRYAALLKNMGLPL